MAQLSVARRAAADVALADAALAEILRGPRAVGSAERARRSVALLRERSAAAAVGRLDAARGGPAAEQSGSDGAAGARPSAELLRRAKALGLLATMSEGGQVMAGGAAAAWAGADGAAAVSVCTVAAGADSVPAGVPYVGPSQPAAAPAPDVDPAAKADEDTIDLLSSDEEAVAGDGDSAAAGRGDAQGAGGDLAAIEAGILRIDPRVTPAMAAAVRRGG